MSPINVFLFDAARHLPMADVPVRLERPVSGYDWEVLTGGVTDMQGRIAQLVPKSMRLSPGTYRLVLEIEDYFRECKVVSTFPFIQVVFETADQDPYQITVRIAASDFTVSVTRTDNQG